MIERLRNKLAKAIADFAIEHIAAPEYSRNLKTTILLGVHTWEELAHMSTEELERKFL